MARAHFVKKARKDHPGGIKKGDSYWWWKFRGWKKQCSHTRPKQSQLTRSPFLSAYYAILERLEEAGDLGEDGAADIVGELEQLAEECEASLDNMPEHLQETSWSGELLQERIDNLNDWIGEIQGIDWEDVTPEEGASAILDCDPGIS